MSFDTRHTQPGFLWLLGYEQMVNSTRPSVSEHVRAESARTAALYFAASQARSFTLLAERLARADKATIPNGLRS
jgi:hypothetical protein